ncbi:MAG: hypothetical protein SA339_07035 [Methanomassiliicoccus sp.]|nr:hypothetical protein [Methanomassiliicoccus sp.]
MPVKIVKQGDDLYAAEVDAANGTWKSSKPLPSVELDTKLIRLGYNILEIDRAFQEVGVVITPDVTYRYAAKVTRPFLQAALAGEREVPEQKPSTEAWFVDALIYDDKYSLERVIAMVDAINHDIPNYDEISWAFLRLRRRGWLEIEGDTYGLTLEGRLAIQDIWERGVSWPVTKLGKWIYVKTGRSILGESTPLTKKLENWISKNPPPGDK